MENDKGGKLKNTTKRNERKIKATSCYNDDQYTTRHDFQYVYRNCVAFSAVVYTIFITVNCAMRF